VPIVDVAGWMESVVEPVGDKESRMKQWVKGTSEEMQMM